MKNSKRWIWPVVLGAIGITLTILQLSGRGINRVRAEASVDAETRMWAAGVPKLREDVEANTRQNAVQDEQISSLRNLHIQAQHRADEKQEQILTAIKEGR